MVQLVDLDNMSGPPPYLCVFHLATAGQQGPNLGSDEEEIVAMIYIVIDKAQNKVVGIQQYLVKPNVANTSDNFLSSEVLMEAPSITEELVKKSLPLEYVILQFDNYVRSLQIDPYQMKFVTDGELPLRQCLHPEACNKNIELPEYYNSFIDLRKDFKAFYSSPEEMGSVREMIEYLRMVPETEPEFYLKEAKDMLNITQRLIADGYRFNNFEHIMIQLEPGLCSKDEEVDPNSVVRARGLPWQSSDGDIAKFFRGLNIEKGGVALCLSSAGRRNGEALVRFVNQAHRDMALKRHKHHMGQRYIEVYKSTGEEFVFVAGGSSTEAHNFLTRGGQVIIRMRGLPYECTAEQVLEFFRTGEHTCEVLDGEDGVLFVKKADGRATGDAFVLFPNESDAPKALSKHRERIGSRYIELFRSTTAEVQQVLNRAQEDPKPFQMQLPTLPAQLPPPPLLPQQAITCGTRRDCIRLRGLPYEAQVEHILDFLGEYAKNIVFQGVHMVYNSNAQPSGEAFIQMDSEASAYHAATHRHHQYMIFGKKQRYVEVFQCSGDDMNSILTGGQVSPKAATSVLSSGIENNMPGVGLTMPPTMIPSYYEPPQVPLMPPPALTISTHANMLLLNQIALQQQQNAIAAASLMQKTSPKSVYAVPPPNYSQWPPELDPYGTLNNNIPQSKATPTPVTSTSKTVLANGQTTDTMALVPSIKPQENPKPEGLPSQSDLYQAYSSYPAYFLPPRVAMYPKLGFPVPTGPMLVPQVGHPVGPVGVLGLKRSWEQAFPMDTAAAAAQAAKRWQPPQMASFAPPGFYEV